MLLLLKQVFIIFSSLLILKLLLLIHYVFHNGNNETTRLRTPYIPTRQRSATNRVTLTNSLQPCMSSPHIVPGLKEPIKAPLRSCPNDRSANSLSALRLKAWGGAALMHAKPTRLCIAYTVYDTALKPMITSPVYRLNALLTTTFHLLPFMKQFPHFHPLVKCKKLYKFPVVEKRTHWFWQLHL